MIKESNEKAARAWVLVLTSLAASMISLDSQVVATALSTIRLHLGASIEELEWTVNAYALSFAVLLMTGVALGDRFGRRRLFVRSCYAHQNRGSMQAYSVFLTLARFFAKDQGLSDRDAENGPYGPFSKQKTIERLHG
jgi:MFS family permease